MDENQRRFTETTVDSQEIVFTETASSTTENAVDEVRTTAWSTDEVFGPTNEQMVRQRKARTEKIAKLQDRLAREMKIKAGIENMLILYNSMKRDPVALNEVQSQLNAAIQRTEQLTQELDQLLGEREKERKTSDTLALRDQVPDALPAAVIRPSTIDSLASNIPNARRTGLQESFSHFRKRSNRSLHHFYPQRTEVENQTRPETDVNSAHLQSIQENCGRILAGAETAQVRLDCMNAVIKSMKQIHDFDWSSEMKTILPCVIFALKDHVPEINASAFRMIRHSLSNAKCARAIWNSDIFLFAMKTLSKDQKSEVQREQVLRFVRAHLDLADAPSAIPPAILSVIAAISETAEDKLKLIAIETLCEFALRDARLVFESGALRVLLQILTDGPENLVSLVVLVIAVMIDHPQSRAFLIPSIDVEMMLSNITDTYGRSKSSDEQLKLSSTALTLLSRSWSGLCLYCYNDFHLVDCLIKCLKMPFDDVKKIVVDTLFNIFQISIPQWLASFVSARGIKAASYRPGTDSRAPKSQQEIIHAQHQAFLLSIFIERNLLEALTGIITDGGVTGTKAVLLLSELFEMSNQLFPSSYQSKIQHLKQLFCIASDFKQTNRQQAVTALSHVDHLNSSKTLSLGANAEKPLRLLKVKLGMYMSDTTFRNYITDTQVLLTKEYSRWNWDLILELLEGPLLNTKRLNEILRTTKFIKRLIAFYAPKKNRFSSLRAGKNSAKYCRIGRSLMKVLLVNSDASLFFKERKFFPQLIACFDELDPLRNSSSEEIVFSKENIEKGVVSEYFMFIGILSGHEEGLRLLEECSIFSAFHHVCEMKNREDIIQLMLVNLDYRCDGHARIILSKALTSGDKFLGNLALQNVPDFSRWGLALLVTQLYDPSLDVCEIAVNVLESVSHSDDNLCGIIALRPSLDQISGIAESLLLRFLAVPEGLEYLNEIGFLNQQAEFWKNEGAIRYTIRQEIIMDSMFFSGLAAENMLPNSELHFYGELAKSSEGCEFLLESGHLQHILNPIVLHKNETENGKILELKASLWSIAHIGSKPRGLELLLSSGVLEHIINLAEKSSVFSLKGTAVYSLSLLSKNPEVAILMREYGWDIGANNFVTMPRSMHRFMNISNWETPQRSESHLKCLPEADPIASDILKNIGNLSNHILASASSKSLAKLKSEEPTYFSDPAVFAKVVVMIMSYRYRLTALRFIFELFDQLELNDCVFEAIQQQVQQSKKFESPNTAASRPVQNSSVKKSDHQQHDEITKKLNSEPEYLKPKVVITDFQIVAQ